MSKLNKIIIINKFLLITSTFSVNIYNLIDTFVYPRKIQIIKKAP